MKRYSLVIVASLMLAACAPTVVAPESTFNLSGELPESVNQGDVDIFIVGEDGFIDTSYAPIGTITITAQNAAAPELAQELLERARNLGADAALIRGRNGDEVPVRYRYTRFRTSRDVGKRYPTTERESYEGTRFVSRQRNPDLVENFGFVGPYITVSEGVQQLEAQLVVYLDL
ncbi:MAG: hypothetical protein AAF708_23060 [Deinococcota bacterium]